MEFRSELQGENVNLETVSSRAPVASQQEEVLKLKSSGSEVEMFSLAKAPVRCVIIQGAPVVP